MTESLIGLLEKCVAPYKTGDSENGSISFEELAREFSLRQQAARDALAIARQYPVEEAQQPASSLVEAEKALERFADSFPECDRWEDEIDAIRKALKLARQHTREPDVEAVALAIANIRRARHKFPPITLSEFRTHKEDFLAIMQEAKACYLAAGWTVKE